MYMCVYTHTLKGYCIDMQLAVFGFPGLMKLCRRSTDVTPPPYSFSLVYVISSVWSEIE